MNARRIWLCADDYGISPSVNHAIRDLIERGRINATSVMVVAPSFHAEEAAALKRLMGRGAAVGLHLTLTAPFRPLSDTFTPLRNEAFLPLGRKLSAAMLRRFDHVNVAAEVAAQLRAFSQAFGVPPDYVDGHQHVHLFPQIRDAVLTTVKRMAPDAWMRQCGRIAPVRARLRDPKGLLLDVLSVGFRRKAALLGVRTNPAFAGTYEFRDDADIATLFPRFFDGLPAGSVVMCHPGIVDEELRRLDPLTTLREREYTYLGGDAFPAVLATRGITLA